MSLIESIKESEGFRSKPYRCTENVLTIGYGFAIKDLELDEDICHQILVKKLDDLIDNANDKFPFLLEIPDEKADIVYEMIYQMGLNGVSKFKLMLKALEKQDFEKASAEMLDSLWAKQTPNRALKMSNKMKG
tara:strand:+ start:366 stop:764 length:399 start_codon:yes stop_codon:yes gene_type:complete